MSCPQNPFHGKDFFGSLAAGQAEEFGVRVIDDERLQGRETRFGRRDFFMHWKLCHGRVR